MERTQAVEQIIPVAGKKKAAVLIKFAAIIICDNNVATMIGHDAVDPRQTEAAMAVLGGEERFKHAGQIIRFNAAAIVFDFDANVSAGCQRSGAILGGFA